MLTKILSFIFVFQIFLSIYGQEHLNTTLVSHYGSGSPNCVDTKNEIVFVNLKHVIKIFDVSDVNKPIRVGEILIDCNTFKLSGDILFVGTDAGLRLFNISDITNIQEIVSSETTNNENFNIGHIAIENDRAYLLIDGNKISIVDISNINFISELNRFNLDGANHSKLFAKNNYIYVIRGAVGTKVYNLEDPNLPVYVTTIPPLRHIDYPWYDYSNIAHIVFKDDYAIITHTDAGLLLVDISNPDNPTRADTFFSAFANREAIFYGDTLYLSDNNFLHLIDFSNILNPDIIAFYDVGTDDYQVRSTYKFNDCLILNGTKIIKPVGSSGFDLIWEYKPFHSANFVQYFNGYCYVSDSYNGLYTFKLDCFSQPTLVKLIELPGPLTITQSFVIINDYLIIGLGAGGIKVIDISIPESAEIISHHDYIADYLVRRNDTLFTLDYTSKKFNILDASDMTNISEISSTILDGWPDRVSIDRNYAFVAVENTGIQIVDFANAEEPILVNTISTSTFSNDVEVAGGNLFVADNSEGLFIYDISDPLNANFISKINLHMPIKDINIYDRYCYLATSSKGVRIIDISELYNLVEVGYFETLGNSNSVSSYNNTIFLTNSWNGLYILENDLIPTVGVEENTTPISYNVLNQNYPNPFNPSTKISFSLAKEDKVKLKVYDITGSEIETIYNGILNAGNYEVNFNGTNLPSGVYIYSIQTADYSSSRKMLLLK